MVRLAIAAWLVDLSRGESGIRTVKPERLLIVNSSDAGFVAFVSAASKLGRLCEKRFAPSRRGF